MSDLREESLLGLDSEDRQWANPDKIAQGSGLVGVVLIFVGVVALALALFLW